MVSHTLAIAKASFAASLLRPDPTTVPRPEVVLFHDYLDALLKQCSSANIQLCKEWILKNTTHSKIRTAALGKYFAATSNSLKIGTDQEDTQSRRKNEPSSRRQQLHLLYLLNDLLHHVEFHAESPAAKVTLVESFPSSLLDILQSATSHSLEQFPKHHGRIQNLLDLWAEQGFYPPAYIQKLRDTAANAAKDHENPEKGSLPLDGVTTEAGQSKKDTPYIMPTSHGDPSTPFHDLPAGNMIPLIIPNSTAPINPQSMRPLQFTHGPAEPKLAAVVEDFLKSVDALELKGFADNGDGGNDIDELGQFVLRDPLTGEVLEGDGYYGWSRAFCEKMKRRGDIRGFGSDMTRDESRSRSESSSPRKRRRYSSSGSHSSYDRGRIVSRSRSRSPERQSSRLISPSRSRSGSSPRDQRHNRSQAAYIQPPLPPMQTQGSSPLPPPLFAQGQGPSPPPPPPFTHGFPLGPGGVPIPPRPAGYSGPWPPPPPPPPGLQGSQPFSYGHPGNQVLPNQGVWGGERAQQAPPPNQGPPYVYGATGQGPPPSSSYGNGQSGMGRSYGRGGWSK